MRRQCFFLCMAVLILCILPRCLSAQDRDLEIVQDADLERFSILDWSERIQPAVDREEQILRQVEDSTVQLAQSGWRDVALIAKIRVLLRQRVDLLQSLKLRIGELVEIVRKIDQKLQYLSVRLTPARLELKSHYDKAIKNLQDASALSKEGINESDRGLEALESAAVGRFENAKIHFQNAIKYHRRVDAAIAVWLKEMEAGGATFARLATAVGLNGDSLEGRPDVTGQKQPPRSSLSPEKGQGGLDVIPRIVRDNEPAIVKITTRDMDGRDLVHGSGFIVDQSGIVVTNHHVIEGAVSATVRLSGGSKHEILGVVALNKDLDLAVLKIKGAIFPTVKLGDSNKLVKGEKVITISSPFGLANAVSDGIISSLLRDGETTLIQTTAPVSIGSSGGPLLSLSGEVVGIMSFVLTKGQNLNFAVPINYVKPLIASKEVPMPLATLALKGKTPELPSPSSTPLPPQSRMSPPQTERPAGPTPSPSDTAPDVTIFVRALEDLASTNYDRAITGFETYISQFANADLIPTAYYLLGESYYNAKYYASAIKSFDVVIELNPDDLTVVGAMLKQGYSYLELGVIERGQATLRKLIRRFPQSSEAQQAVRRLQELGLQ